MIENLYDRPAVSEITTLSRHTILRQVKAGTFPKPIKRGNKLLWKESQLEAWMEEQGGGKEAA